MNAPRLLALCVLSAIPTASAFAQCEDKLMANDATNQDRFGSAVALSSTTAVVGAPFEGGSRGSAYVFGAGPMGWTQQAKLVATAGQTGDQFGMTVAVDGDTIAVGAPFADSMMHMQSGSVHVFNNTPGGWNEVQMLRASDNSFQLHFGFSVSISGDWMAVGVPYRSVPLLDDSGAVYMFENVGGVWVERQIVVAGDPAPGDFFGISVSLSGDNMVVGAPFDDDGGTTSSGSAYFFERSGSTWTELHKVTASILTTLDEFGRAVSISGDQCVIGARNDDDFGFDAGAAYVFVRFGPNWFNTQKLTASNAAGGDRFGTTVSITNNMIAVGSPYHESPEIDRGSAHVFETNGGGWLETNTLYASDGLALDRFGESVAAGGSSVIIGAINNDQAGSNAGAAYMYPIIGPDCDQNGVLDQCETSYFESYCFGNGGDNMGCTSCPCGNDAPSTTCGGCINASGTSAALVASGVPAVINDSLHFDLHAATPDTFAVLFSGANRMPGNMAHPCFGLDSGLQSLYLDGLRCSGGEGWRHGTRATDSSGSSGLTNNGWGTPSPHWIFLSGFVAGQTRHYQGYYRESAAVSCGTGQNTTNAISMTFLP